MELKEPVRHGLKPLRQNPLHGVESSYVLGNSPQPRYLRIHYMELKAELSLAKLRRLRLRIHYMELKAYQRVPCCNLILYTTESITWS